jgi:hypothetical protein
MPDDRTPPSRISSPRGGDVLFNLFSSALADRFIIFVSQSLLKDNK